MAQIPGSGYFTYSPTFTATAGYFPIDWTMGIDYSQPIKQSKVVRGNCEGYECIGCKEFNHMSDLNFPEDSKDPHSFKCWLCRNKNKIF